MNASQVLVQGKLKSDGTLELSEHPNLPPGPVEVLIRVQAASNGGGETWWEFLQRSRADLIAQGKTMRSPEEIDGDRSGQRASDEARRQGIQDLQTPKE